MSHRVGPLNCSALFCFLRSEVWGMGIWRGGDCESAKCKRAMILAGRRGQRAGQRAKGVQQVHWYRRLTCVNLVTYGLLRRVKEGSRRTRIGFGRGLDGRRARRGCTASQRSFCRFIPAGGSSLA